MRYKVILAYSAADPTAALEGLLAASAKAANHFAAAGRILLAVALIW